MQSKINAMRILLILVCAMGYCSAQNPIWVVAAHTQYGFIIPHHKFLRDISQSRPWGIEVSLSRHYINEKVWDLYGCFPRVGGQLSYFNFGNPAQLGSSWVALGFVEPFFNHRQRLKTSLRMGTGPAFMTVVYHPVHNPENVFVSSHLSFAVIAQLHLSYSVSPVWAVKSGICYGHISNGGLKEPNRGINFPMASVGVEYSLSQAVFPQYQREKTVSDLYPRRWGAEAATFFSAKKLDSIAWRIPVVGFWASANWIAGKTSMLKAGLELSQDWSLAERNKSGGNFSTFTAAAVIGHDFLMGRFRIQSHLGMYILKPSPSQANTYQRVGLDARFWRGAYTGISLKAHTYTADFLDFRLGWRY